MGLASVGWSAGFVASRLAAGLMGAYGAVLTVGYVTYKAAWTREKTAETVLVYFKREI